MATKQQTTDFILMIAPLMQKEAKSRGYKIVSTAIAQACIESAWGQSGLARYNNFFGMKCGSKWTGRSVNMKTREEYTPGTLTTIRDNFRAFDSVADGIKGYYDFINANRYANLKDANTPEEYAKMLKADGYATSSSYVDTLIHTVSSYGLSRYDHILQNVFECESPEEPKNGNPYNEPVKNVRFNSRGNDARWLQFELNRRNYHLIVDGIAGEKTITALKDFQEKARLDPDGICGVLTRTALKKET